MRARGSDLLRLKRDPDAASRWIGRRDLRGSRARHDETAILKERD